MGSALVPLTTVIIDLPAFESTKEMEKNNWYYKKDHSVISNIRPLCTFWANTPGRVSGGKLSKEVIWDVH